MFLCELSMTLCLIYKTKCSEQSSDTIQDAIKNKLSTCSLCWDPSDICTKTRTSCLNQTRQSERSFTTFVLTTDSSVWTVSESERAYVNSIQCRQDIASHCNFYSTLAFSVIKCQPLRGLCFVKVLLWRQCLCKCLWHHLAPQIQTSRFWSLIK